MRENVCVCVVMAIHIYPLDTLKYMYIYMYNIESKHALQLELFRLTHVQYSRAYSLFPVRPLTRF